MINFAGMQVLNLPPIPLKTKSTENKVFIFDEFRKKYIVLTPEEWVRQHFVHFLKNQKKYPPSLIALEKQLTINGLKKRTDIVVYNQNGLPHIIVECKAPSVAISQAVFDQIARYNLKLNANYLIVTNGIQHFYCQLDLDQQQYLFLPEIPNYQSL